MHILMKFGVEVIDTYVSSAEQKIMSAAKLWRNCNKDTLEYVVKRFETLHSFETLFLGVHF